MDRGMRVWVHADVVVSTCILLQCRSAQRRQGNDKVCAKRPAVQCGLRPAPPACLGCRSSRMTTSQLGKMVLSPNSRSAMSPGGISSTCVGGDRQL